MSSGETALLDLFLSILRDFDLSGATFNNAAEIRGIVVVDEIDLHLHAVHQHEILPSLMRMFPKVQIGVDSQTGVVHSMTTTSANVHDLTELPRLLHGGESQVWGDAGYQGVDKRPGNRGLDVEWQVAMRPGQRRKLEPGSPEAVSEKRKASVRAKVEHPFLYIKRHYGYAKVRYRGLSKNTQRLMTLLGFANLMRAEQYLAA